MIVRTTQMLADRQTSIQSDQSAYRAHFDGGVSTLMSQMWGGNLHMGYFNSADEPLASARCERRSRSQSF